jgi:bifunctional N-acetylglucosamine-1-phosphate-uridyltransferase/glucosamine-1-phosphate-acetyltransferase GlmU-like protein
MLEFGKKLAEAHKLCEQANIRYEDYIDRVLQLPRTTAKTITKISTENLNPAVGFENMKMISRISDAQKRNEAEQQILSGKSPDTVRSMMVKKSQEVDVKTRLEKEKSRLEKTISQLTSRLEMVNESLSNL